eukprot:NODE_2062_length_996_cov_84.625132_g1684_i0.p1 GENE.NODE_2062_length_996_cov_84.625132_g1684_i0~~NODE_2062_length_996_cov_84.625132_g1684_i0.p1  ORF type:complete len:261 (-),score=42.34 NODE_2062_length_996_cov_84.625132_g1684_i0:73-855(-)
MDQVLKEAYAEMSVPDDDVGPAAPEEHSQQATESIPEYFGDDKLPVVYDPSNLPSSSSGSVTNIYPILTSLPKRSPASLRPVIMPRSLISDFLVSASPNLRQGIEWCGILAGILRAGSFYVSHVLIPKQTCTPDTCTALNEMQLFEYQAAHDLLTIGWIHTHPEMDAFLSSVDLHTHAGYQSLLDEAVAVVCSPSKVPSYGIFRVANDALPILQRCDQRGFHEHMRPNGSKMHNEELFMQCTHVREVDTVDYPTALLEIQ